MVRERGSKFPPSFIGLSHQHPIKWRMKAKENPPHETNRAIAIFFIVCLGFYGFAPFIICTSSPRILIYLASYPSLFPFSF